MQIRIVLESEAAAAVERAVRAGIRESDPPHLPRRDYRPLCVSLRGESDSVFGGIYGGTMWCWLMIDGLWVAEELRGQGFGSQLLNGAEVEAVRRGCVGAWLGTFDFQARGFYERHGYTVFAELPGFPAGHSHYHLRKALDPHSGTGPGSVAGGAGPA
jgi:GNAT superfamily N-acetyltransferase